MDASAAAVVRDYYDALRAGDPLEPFFRESESTVKFGISEALFGYDEVKTALREQTATTDGWTVRSGHLVVEERDAFATVADEVIMAWTNVETGDRRRFDTRWSGTLVPARTGDDASDRSADGTERDGDEAPGDEGPAWLFTTMHVSAAGEL